MPVPKLTTIAACRVAGINRDRFNEHVAAGNFGCAPKTIPGRARLFDPDAMLALKLFAQLIDDGFGAERAGAIACSVADAAKIEDDEPVIVYLETYLGSATSRSPKNTPDPKDWPTTPVSGSTIKRATSFNVAHLRALIDHGTEEERSIIGADDE